MTKTQRFFRFTSWAMVAVGLFSVVTGFFSVLGFSELIADKVGEETLFSFINGGAYFMLCGMIHILAGSLGIRRIKGKIKGIVCILIGIFTLAWQLAAFIYLFTLSYLSIRAALMVILPIIYLTLIIAAELQRRLVPAQSAGSSDDQTPTKKTFVVKDIFGNFNFTFKRKSFDFQLYEGKRKNSKHFNGFNFGNKRRKTKRISMRKFKRR